MRDLLTKKLLRHTLIVVGSYSIISILWILFSDQMVVMFFDADDQQQAQSYKGVIFVLATALFLLLLIERKNSAIEELFNRLQNKMKTFQDTFEQAAVGIAHLSMEDEWIRVNKKLCDMLGYSKQELKTLRPADFIHEDDLEKGKEKDRQLIAGTINSYVMKKRYITKPGDVLYGKVTKSAIFNGQEHPSYLIAIVEDISKEHAATEELKATIEQKKLLVREIHHRVKNNLAIISGLLELQTFDTTDDTVHRSLKNAMMRIKSMALIHESFYQSHQASFVAFDEYLKAFVDHIKSLPEFPKEGMRINLHSKPVKLDINQAIPLGLLINEAIVCIYGYNFKNQQKGIINIFISQNSKIVTLEIKIKDQELPSDFDLESSNTIETRIINTLAMQLKGDLDIKSDDEIEFSISFKKEDQKGSSRSISSNLLL